MRATEGEEGAGGVEEMSAKLQSRNYCDRTDNVLVCSGRAPLGLSGSLKELTGSYAASNCVLSTYLIDRLPIPSLLRDEIHLYT